MLVNLEKILQVSTRKFYGKMWYSYYSKTIIVRVINYFYFMNRDREGKVREIEMSSETSRTSRQVYKPSVIAVLTDLPIERVNMLAENLEAEFDRFTTNVETVFGERMPGLSERQLADVWACYLPYEAFIIICNAPPEIRISRRNMQEMIIKHERNRREEERRTNDPPAFCTRSKCQSKRFTE